jgi:DNA-binding PadR family transcriptional regulator
MLHEKEEVASDWLKETRKGYLRIAVLTLLSRKPHHGYEIMKEIDERSGGFWKPTAGGIYPILQSLEESEYIDGKWDAHLKRKRKTYQITEAGRSMLQQAFTRQSQIADNMGDLFREFMKDVLDVRSAARPPIPTNLFSAFLEDKGISEDSVHVLKRRKRHIQRAMGNMQKELDRINTRLLKMEAHKEESKEDD